MTKITCNIVKMFGISQKLPILFVNARVLKGWKVILCKISYEILFEPSKNMLMSGQAPESYAHNRFEMPWNLCRKIRTSKKYAFNRNMLITGMIVTGMQCIYRSGRIQTLHCNLQVTFPIVFKRRENSREKIHSRGRMVGRLQIFAILFDFCQMNIRKWHVKMNMKNLISSVILFSTSVSALW